MVDEPACADIVFVPVGANPARVFGLEARTRACRLAAKAGMECADEVARDRPNVLADLRFAWDPAWLTAIRNHPGTVLMSGGEAILAHVPSGQDPGPVQAAMASSVPWSGDGSSGEQTNLVNELKGAFK